MVKVIEKVVAYEQEKGMKKARKDTYKRLDYQKEKTGERMSWMERKINSRKRKEAKYQIEVATNTDHRSEK